MESALRIYSWKGILRESSIADEIKSRQHARRLGPFLSPDKRELVTWVRAVWKGNRKIRRSCFRRLPGTTAEVDIVGNLRSEVETIRIEKARSTIHNPSRDALAETLRKHIGSPISWGLRDPEYSDFPAVGDLMAHVEEIATEYRVKTPFGVEYAYDIALLGPMIKKRRVILGVIELELEHEFESTKCLISKCLGFPLISLDLKSVTSSGADGDSLLESLVETTHSTDEGRRINFFYLHPSLYPVFLAPPSNFRLERRHQFVIFAEHARLTKIRSCLDSLREALGMSKNEVVIQPVPRRNTQVASQFENEGSIAGHDWRSFNIDEYLRVTLDRPAPGNEKNLFFHLTMAKIVNSDFPALVGYKYEKGIHNDDPKEPIWTRPVLMPDNSLGRTRIAPKHISEPIDSILKVISNVRSGVIREEAV